MNLIIKKFREANGTVKNYCDTPSFIDQIEFNQLPADCIPSSTLEWLKNDNGYNITASDFNLKLSLTQTNRSQVQNKSIRDFLIDGNNLFVVYLQVFGRVLGGTIKTDTISVNYAFNEWNIEFTVISLESEISRFLAGMPVKPVPMQITDSSMTFEQYITFFFTGLPFYVHVVNNLNISNHKVPFTVVVSSPLQQRIISHGQGLNKGLGRNSAQILSEMSMQLGFTWRVNFSAQQGGSNYFNLDIILFFRSDAEVKTIQAIMHTEGIDLSNTAKYAAFPMTIKLLETFLDGSYGYIATGAVISKDAFFTSDDPQSTDAFQVVKKSFIPSVPLNSYRNEGIYFPSSASGFPQYVHSDYVRVLEPPQFYSPLFTSHNWGGVDISYSRIFVKQGTVQYNSAEGGYIDDAGQNEILHACTLTELKFLCSGAAITKKIKLSYLHTPAVNLLDVTEIGFRIIGGLQVPVKYFCHKLENFEPHNFTEDSYWIEVI